MELIGEFVDYGSGGYVVETDGGGLEAGVGIGDVDYFGYGKNREIGIRPPRNAPTLQEPAIAGACLRLQLLPKLAGKQATGVDAKVDSRRERNKRCRILCASYVLYADLNSWPASRPSLAGDSRRHHEPSICGEWPKTVSEVSAASRAATGGASAAAGGGGEEFEAVTKSVATVSAATLTPCLEAAPWLPGAVTGAEDEPGARVATAHPVGSWGGDEGCHHRRHRCRRAGEIVDSNRPPLSLLRGAAPSCINSNLQLRLTSKNRLSREPLYFNAAKVEDGGEAGLGDDAGVGFLRRKDREGSGLAREVVECYLAVAGDFPKSSTSSSWVRLSGLYLQTGKYLYKERDKCINMHATPDDSDYSLYPNNMMKPNIVSLNNAIRFIGKMRVLGEYEWLFFHKALFNPHLLASFIGFKKVGSMQSHMSALLDSFPLNFERDYELCAEKIASTFTLVFILLCLARFSFLTQESEFSSPMFGRHIRLVNIRSFLSTLYSLFRFGQVNVEFPLSFLFALLFRFGQASIESSHSPFRFGQVDIELFSFVVFEFGQTDVEFPLSGWVPDRVPGGILHHLFIPPVFISCLGVVEFSVPFVSLLRIWSGEHWVVLIHCCEYGQVSIESPTFTVSIWSSECWAFLFFLLFCRFDLVRQIVTLFLSTLYSLFRFGQCSWECKIPFLTLLFRSGQAEYEWLFFHKALFNPHLLASFIGFKKVGSMQSHMSALLDSFPLNFERDYELCAEKIASTFTLVFILLCLASFCTSSLISNIKPHYWTSTIHLWTLNFYNPYNEN
ncbi:hypothetical protein M5K25_014885 [Dendrobium thyrsiflorum]|uniref:Uncharacterized protein n=1 Tax=Dendrobium thyrsiflorum TaxID=117978 RepID=A0ABD0UP61_DENTH